MTLAAVGSVIRDAPDVLATFKARRLPESEAREMLEGLWELNRRTLQRSIDAGAPRQA